MKFKELLLELSPFVALVLLIWALAFSMQATAEETQAPIQWTSGYCAACHGVGAEGGVGPRLVGQTSIDIVSKLVIYRDKGNVGNRSNMMWANAEKLTDEDIATLAEYITGLDK
jgi:cytochrome c553|tara:strand:+ start:620 stop:961 length:342 start_codon:yes stop_codon:yes gene_type:complete